MQHPLRPHSLWSRVRTHRLLKLETHDAWLVTIKGPSRRNKHNPEYSGTTIPFSSRQNWTRLGGQSPRPRQFRRCGGVECSDVRTALNTDGRYCVGKDSPLTLWAIAQTGGRRGWVSKANNMSFRHLFRHLGQGHTTRTFTTTTSLRLTMPRSAETANYQVIFPGPCTSPMISHPSISFDRNILLV